MLPDYYLSWFGFMVRSKFTVPNTPLLLANILPGGSQVVTFASAAGPAGGKYSALVENSHITVDMCTDITPQIQRKWWAKQSASTNP